MEISLFSRYLTTKTNTRPVCGCLCWLGMWGEKFPDKQSSPGLDLVLSKQHFIFSNTCGGEIIGNKRVFYIKTLKLSKTEYTGQSYQSCLPGPEHDAWQQCQPEQREIQSVKSDKVRGGEGGLLGVRGQSPTWK